jgi:hypothetical protein
MRVSCAITDDNGVLRNNAPRAIPRKLLIPIDKLSFEKAVRIAGEIGGSLRNEGHCKLLVGRGHSDSKSARSSG